jgi:mycothiol synthase
VPATKVADELSWRAPTRADLPAWHAAVVAVEAVDRTGELLTEADLADQLEISFFDAENDGRLLWSPEGQVVAYATVESRPSGHQRRVSLAGGVHPAWRRKGIGRALVEWQVERGEAIGAAADRSLPGWLEFFADEHDAARSALFADFAFAPHRYFLEMRRPLREPVPEVVPAGGLRLVRFDPEHDDATRLAHNEAFLDHWGSSAIDEETWSTWVTGHRDFRADLSFLVLAGDEIAGYAINAAHPAEWEALGFSEAWTHQLGVRRAWRGQGVARALLAASMQAFADDGLEFAALDVDAENPTGALALYLGMGYERDRARVAWARQLEGLTQE